MMVNPRAQAAPQALAKTVVHRLGSVPEASDAAANLVAEASAQAVRRRGHFTIALCGGATPRPLFQALASPAMADRIAWDRWRVFWGDERAVPPDHPDSNYRFARETLLDRVPVNPASVYRIHAEAGREAGADAYAGVIRRILGPAEPSFDLILLGLGEDGHSASLFPGTAALAETEHLVVANWVPRLEMYRITFTLPLINAAGCVAFFVTGESKARAVRWVLGAPEDIGRPAPPAAMVRPRGALHWFLDAEAASQLPPAP